MQQVVKLLIKFIHGGLCLLHLLLASKRNGLHGCFEGVFEFAVGLLPFGNNASFCLANSFLIIDAFINLTVSAEF